MKPIKHSLSLLALSFVFAGTAFAQQHDHHDHANETAEEHAKHAGEDEHAGHDHSPHHGGIVSIVNEIHHELVTTDGKVQLYAEGLPEGKAREKVSVRLTILRGNKKSKATLNLSKDNDHRFDGDASLKLQSGDKIVALFKIPGQKPRLVKFEMP